MRRIRDIRLFKSSIPYKGFPPYCGSRTLNENVDRIALKLREQGFSLGDDFDHLYINFTTCAVDGKIALRKDIDRYHPWYRFCDVEIDRELYEKIDSNDSAEQITYIVGNVLKTFALNESEKDKIDMCINEALSLKENMLVKYKEKKSTKNTAIIYLRLNNFKFYPLLKVFGLDGQVLLEKDLPPMSELGLIGEITLSTKRVKIKPRKNSYNQSHYYEPFCFDIPQ